MNKYIKYMKDNPKGYWFKRKIYGWGWTPVRWQGWAFIILWLALFFEFFSIAHIGSSSESDTIIRLIVPYILLIAMLFLVCYGTGEKPKWTWGLKLGKN